MVDLDLLLNEYRSEVLTAIGSYETWKTIQNQAARDAGVLAQLNSDVRAWLSIIHSLQLTYLIVLGRIFDEDRRTLTLATLLGKCRFYKGQFSRNGIRERRLRELNGKAPTWLEEYVNALEEPTDADFAAIERSLQAHLATYRESFKDVRDKLMAHRELASLGAADALYAKTSISDLEALLDFAYGVGEVLWQWMHNGKRAEVGTYRYLQAAGDTRLDVEAMLSKVSGERREEA